MKFQTAAISTGLFLASAQQAFAQTIRATVIAANEAPNLGTCQSPVWFGIHDGSFDIYDRNAPSSPVLERIAEDGNAGPLSEFFLQQPGITLDGTFQGPLCPGETQYFQIEFEYSEGNPLYFSYASMILPSNDAFVANGNPMAHPIVDSNGNFVEVFILDSGSDILDAGTEVNDEIPANTAFFGQTVADAGTPTPGGVIVQHPGFNARGTDGILDSPQFANADFTQDGYNALRIQVVLDVEYTGTVRVTNTAPELGTCQTPVWVGIHDGQFDTYDRNAPTSPALEPLAEDGNAEPLVMDFANNPGGFWDGVVGTAPFCSGEVLEIPFAVRAPFGVPLYFSYASMVVPSNDAFLSNGNPQAFEITTAQAQFVSVLVEDFGSDVLDAGTEVNDEIPANTAFFGQTVPDSGTLEVGVVVPHPGFNAVGTGGILDSPEFANADFSIDPENYELMTIEVFLVGDEPSSGGALLDFLTRIIEGIASIFGR